MNIYLPINTKVEDLVNILEDLLKAGAISSRQVLEVTTEDKSIAAFLKSICAEAEDEVNAPVRKIVKRGPKGKRMIVPDNGHSRMASVNIEEA